jgi:methylmalonyl-CoA mutase C-terminal domain/subunit
MGAMTASRPVGHNAAMTIRAVLGMLGADTHNKGLRTFARRLRDLGAEVIYIGDHNTAEQLAAAAVAEDADVVGVSFGMASYLAHCTKLVEALRAIGAEDIPIMVGGLVHREDTDALNEIGVQGVFTPGHTMDEVVTWLEQVTGKRLAGAA